MWAVGYVLEGIAENKEKARECSEALCERVCQTLSEEDPGRMEAWKELFKERKAEYDEAATTGHLQGSLWSVIDLFNRGLSVERREDTRGCEREGSQSASTSNRPHPRGGQSQALRRTILVPSGTTQ